MYFMNLIDRKRINFRFNDDEYEYIIYVKKSETYL